MKQARQSTLSSKIAHFAWHPGSFVQCRFIPQEYSLGPLRACRDRRDRGLRWRLLAQLVDLAPGAVLILTGGAWRLGLWQASGSGRSSSLGS